MSDSTGNSGSTNPDHISDDSTGIPATPATTPDTTPADTAPTENLGPAPVPTETPVPTENLGQAPAPVEPTAAAIVSPIPAPVAPVNHTPTNPTTPYPAQGYGAPQQPAPQQPAPLQPAPQQPYYGNGAFGSPVQSYTAPDPAFNSAMYAASGAYVNQATAPKPPKKRRGGVALVAALAIGALIGGASGAGVTAWVVTQNDSGTTTSASSPTSITVNNPDSANLITAVAAKASPSVVTISVQSDSAAGTGSGVILSEDGYIVTNTHVVTLDGETNDPSIKVETNDGKIWDATIIGTDPVADLAVIKLDDASGLTPIEFADSSKLNVGDVTIAIGAPLGLAGTVTNGIVSALNRSITVASSAAPDDTETNPTPDQGDGEQGPYDFWNFDIPGQEEQSTPQQTTQQQSISLSVIQTDAAINPGNSGGALLDSEGKLIGINVAIASAGSSSTEAGNIGVGFSIPVNLVKRVTDEIIENGTATHGLLGATVGDAASAEGSTTAGALIQSVTSGGAAEKAGLAAGDVVTALDGLPVTDSIDLTALVRTQAAGSEVQLTYLRDGDSHTVDVTLGQLAAQ
ncbi:trypsin-like peptidase domain-containing protein [Herbiconiux moechotypicola]|uniref:PDZ domain-containing protein n=1 Tax=Herbiconiux moechotypicola TaxID=637393 RepID=A0ABN3DNM9_9MICO|nr:trypsin-like peptidase domain-containing protein [Herbiconiux moechotypicola]MCS5730372.1 trypsin-like peptidase domain-containing protein [Herbiconiux moechotypicola]